MFIVRLGKMFSHIKQTAGKLIFIVHKVNTKAHQLRRFIHNPIHRSIPQDRHLKRLALKVGNQQEQEMKNLILIVILISLISPSYARSDGGNNGNNKKSSQKYNNPSGRENCYYCWKDTSLEYTPSRHKYAKKL